MITDARGPTSWNATPEGRKLRAKILAGVEARMRKRNALVGMGRHDDPELDRYARALGLSRGAALALAEKQTETLAAFKPDPIEPAALPPRRRVNARGPTNWSQDAEAKRLRASLLAAIDRRVQTGIMSKAERALYSNAAMSEGNRPR